MIWGNDFDFDDYGFSGEGIVGGYTCNNKHCDVDMVSIYTPIE
jgi:hypothetical protein|tara:strand:- start:7333 stop:7461 length:129 start_codon:yes stop_codon:yes gene_type:complete